MKLNLSEKFNCLIKRIKNIFKKALHLIAFTSLITIVAVEIKLMKVSC